MDTMQIEWVFFDIGGTLLDERETFDRWIHRTIEMQKSIGNEYTVKQLKDAMLAAAREGRSYFRGAMSDIGITYYAPHDSVGEVLYPEVKSVLMSLSQKYTKALLPRASPVYLTKPQQML